MGTRLGISSWFEICGGGGGESGNKARRGGGGGESGNKARNILALTN